VSNWFDQETERRYREEVRRREEDVLRRVWVDALIDRAKADTSCDASPERPANIRLTDGYDPYAPKTAEQIAFTALVHSGGIGSNVTDWFNSLNKA